MFQNKILNKIEISNNILFNSYRIQTKQCVEHIANNFFNITIYKNIIKGEKYRKKYVNCDRYRCYHIV